MKRIIIPLVTLILIFSFAITCQTPSGDYEDSMEYGPTLDVIDRDLKRAEEERKRKEAGEEETIGGIGVVLEQDPESMEITVVKVFEGYPAADADIRIGDRIVSIGSTDIEDIPLDDVVYMILGPVDSIVYISIERPEEGFFGKTLKLQELTPELLAFEEELTEEPVTEEEKPPESNCGVGFILTVDSQGNIIVDMVLDGFPAANAGIQKGDQIIGVDGVDIEGKDINSVVDLITGEEDTEVVITTNSGEFTLTRQPLPDKIPEEEPVSEEEPTEEPPPEEEECSCACINCKETCGDVCTCPK